MNSGKTKKKKLVISTKRKEKSDKKIEDIDKLESYIESFKSISEVDIYTKSVELVTKIQVSNDLSLKHDLELQMNGQKTTRKIVVE